MVRGADSTNGLLTGRTPDRRVILSRIHFTGNRVYQDPARLLP